MFSSRLLLASSPVLERNTPHAQLGAAVAPQEHLIFTSSLLFFLNPKSSSSSAIPSGEWVCSGKGLEAFKRSTSRPRPGESKGEPGSIPQPCLGLSSLPQPPQIPRSVYSRGPVAFQFPWALQGWCTHGGMPGRCRRRGQRCRGYHVTPHRAQTHLSSPSSIFSCPLPGPFR